MEWVEENKFLTGFIIAMILILGVGGYFFFGQMSGYKDAKQAFDGKAKSVKRLKSREPYPKDENLAALKKSTEDYLAAANKLHAKMATLQVPLDFKVSDATYRDVLKKNVIDVQKRASAKGMALPEGFYLGLDGGVTKTEQVPLQNFRRKAMMYVMDVLLGSDVSALGELTLKPLTAEDIEPGGKPIRPHSVKLVFEGSDQAMIKVMNALSNVAPAPQTNETYFFLIKTVRVENEQEQGPERIAAVAAVTEAAPAIPKDDFGIGFDDDDQAATSGENDRTDAEIILGKEKVKCCLMMDLMRFGTPEEAAVPTEKSRRNSK